MKSEKLQDAIGMVDEELVEKANRKKKKLSIKWTAAVAACLAIVFGVAVYFNSGIPMAIEAQALAKAQYPEMAKYPEGEMLPGFEERYDDWSADRRKQRQFYGAGEELDGFFAKTVSEFLTSKEDENLVYSPLNVYMALAMLAETTDGDSRAQILSLLGYGDIETLRQKANAVWNANYSDDGAVTSILASSLWLNEGGEFNQNTLDTLAENYYASSYSGEMGSSELNKALQAWMNEQTGGLLEEYISDIELTPNTLMALVTTIYFRAKWEDEFTKSNNSKDTFHAASGDVECEFMNCTETYGRYYAGEKFGATSKSLENSGSMWFILPDEGVDVNDILTDEQALALMCMDTSKVESKSLRVNLSLPKFDVMSKLDLAAGLKNLGVTDCFSASDADFSPLADDSIWLDKVEHGARVAIDEEGVVAAAYTEMLLCGAAMPPEDEIDFVLDRPFVFVITGTDNLPLFVGVVNNP